MPEVFIEIEFPEVSASQMEVLVAILSESDYYGFQEEENSLKAYISFDEFDEAYLIQFSKQLGVRFSKKTIQQTNWNQVWESNFQPVIVDDYCAIRAHFHAPIEGMKHEIVITPKMSFGTGHHATTFLMIRQMKDIAFNHKTVFDFGTGTGILAILAEKEGASSVLAIDNDEWSIDNAKENIANNDSHLITLLKTSAPISDNTYDIILANINKVVIMQHISLLSKQLSIGGVLLLSGLLRDDKNDIMQAATANHLVYKDCVEKDNWICMRFDK